MSKRPHRTSTRTLRSAALVVPLTCALIGGTMAASAPAFGVDTPTVEARVKPIITVGGQQFRDLNANGHLDAYEDWRLTTDQRVADLVPRMTLLEKASLMMISSYNVNGTPTAIDRGNRYFIVRDDPEPSVLAERHNGLQQRAEGTRLGIPNVMASNPRNHVAAESIAGHAEAAGGQLSDWPSEPGLGATNDPALIKEFAQIAAREWRAVGIQKGYMYMADVATEPRWTRANGTFGEDPQLAADMIRAVVEGFQGEELGSHSVALTTKHFPGGGPRVEGTDPHFEWGQTNEYPTEGSLFAYHLPPFQAAIEAGTSSIMPYYARPENDGTADQLPKHLWFSPTQQFEEVGMTFNDKMIGGLLRGELGFEGYVNSDTGAVGGENWGVEHLTLAEQYAKAINAGTNMFSGGADPTEVVNAVNAGLVTEARIDQSISYLLAEIFELGLFEDPYTDPAEAQAIADSAQSQARADEAHRKSLVLLRNGGADQWSSAPLPITAADESEVRLYVEVFRRDQQAAQTASVRQSIAQLWPGVELVDDPANATHSLLWVVPSLAWNRDDTAGDPPSVVLDLNDDTRIDVDRINSVQSQIETNILVLNSTNPWLIDNIEGQADAIVASFNTRTDALVGLLRGQFDPSGNLPWALPKDLAAVQQNASDVPSYAETFDYELVDAAGNEYAFGFGLQYSTTTVTNKGRAFTAAVTAWTEGADIPTGTVQFSLNGQPVGDPVELKNGSAKLAIPASLGVGTVTAEYSGDSTYASSIGDGSATRGNR